MGELPRQSCLAARMMDDCLQLPAALAQSRCKAHASEGWVLLASQPRVCVLVCLHESKVNAGQSSSSSLRISSPTDDADWQIPHEQEALLIMADPAYELVLARLQHRSLSRTYMHIHFLPPFLGSHFLPSAFHVTVLEPAGMR